MNDVHSLLNRTEVARIVYPASAAELKAAIKLGVKERMPIALAGGRHAMGGQQFASAGLLVDMRNCDHVVSFDPDRGLVEVESGMQWPELVRWLIRKQHGRKSQWGITQKPTGADRLTLGGALAANIHGRGLRFRPFVQDIESFTIVDATGTLRRCSRTEDAELFSLAIGGYGLFGPCATLSLRLSPRRKLERTVEVRSTRDLSEAFGRRISEGYTYGDFQYATDRASEDFLRIGLFSCYRPVDDSRTMPQSQRELSAADWEQLYRLAHTDRRKAFEVYSNYYLKTNGQLYWSDEHQLSLYIDDYHRALDRDARVANPGSEMITEIYVPRPKLLDFLEAVRSDFIANQVDVIYGTIRLIEPDSESFLAWAREPFACVIFNLHVEHTPAGIEHSAGDFRRLIDEAIKHGGSYYLTYHRWARRAQVEACHPRMASFLERKVALDPLECFQSDWYRHYRKMFCGR